jgi:hypothetical protein
MHLRQLSCGFQGQSLDTRTIGNLEATCWEEETPLFSFLPVCLRAIVGAIGLTHKSTLPGKFANNASLCKMTA